MSQQSTERVPKQMQAKFEEIVSLTDTFCQKHLNDEYAQICRKLVAALSRKRPSPLATGKANTWACGIVHALGMVNFLFDPSQVPHISASEIYKQFAVSQSTGSAKSKQVRDAMGMYQMDPKWCVPSNIDKNPLVWMVSINGLPTDIRNAPREIQAEAFRQRLIPYLPEEQQK